MKTTKILACLAAAAIPAVLAITGYSDAPLIGMLALVAIVLIADK